MLADIIAYRNYILATVVRDIRSRYRGSLLGFLWIIIPPVVMIAIYSIVFSALMKARLPQQTGTFAYSIYLCAGLLLWNGFVDIVQRAKNVFIDNANMIKKAVFPRSILFVNVLLYSLFNLAISLGLFTLFAIFVAPLNLSLLNLVPVVALMSLLALGIGLLVSTLNVFFRDVAQITDLGLQFLFWLTPIAYPIQILPAWAQDLLRLNPLAGLFGISQNAYLQGASPSVGAWPYPAAITLLVLGIGLFAYRKLRNRILDEL